MNLATENKIDELVSESNSPLPLVKVFTYEIRSRLEDIGNDIRESK